MSNAKKEKELKKYLCHLCGGSGLISQKNGRFQCASCGVTLRWPDMDAEIVGHHADDVSKVVKEVVESRGSTEGKISINITGGQIGTLNLGTLIGNIENNLTAISKSEDKELAEMLKTLIEKIISSTQLSNENKRETIEQLELLSEQAKLPKKDRKTGIIKAVCSRIGSALSNLGDFRAIWPVALELIKRVFGINL